MTDLQLGLLAIGGLVVAAVLVFNRVQERKAGRAAQRAFASGHADVLLDAKAAIEVPEPMPSVPAHATGGVEHALPDDRVDYVVVLRTASGMPGAAVLEAWRPLEARFGRRALIAGSDGSGWRRLAAGDLGSYHSLRASLQMVSRAGVVPDGELIEFRAEAENMATRIGANVEAPEMRAALEGARELDRACADADIQVALHVVGVAVDADALAGRPFHATLREDGLTLTLDVARTHEPARAFEAMARAGRQLAGATGRLVDDRGRVLDDRALAAIEAELESVKMALGSRGIEPGSPLALRLFS
ncbi:MAG: hypothetical protein JO035_03460 [Betaproteobacteria bacterium]|nr:hypothetical protein [Betaproteobacteria bacterium]